MKIRIENVQYNSFHLRRFRENGIRKFAVWHSLVIKCYKNARSILARSKFYGLYLVAFVQDIKHS